MGESYKEIGALIAACRCRVGAWFALAAMDNMVDWPDTTKVAIGSTGRRTCISLNDKFPMPECD